MIAFLPLAANLSASGAAAAQVKNTTEPLTPREQIIGQFKALDLRFTGGRYQDDTFAYRLYVPPHLDKTAKNPLVLWFHGAGESGNDNRMQLAHIVDALLLYERERGPFPGFILVPQAPKGAGWYAARSPQEDDMLTIAWGMLLDTIREFPTDEDRILLAGVSSGGNACWEMGMRHPDQFAAIAPIASQGGDWSRAAELVGTPVWAFNNVRDQQAPIEGPRHMVDAIRAAGGCAKLTVIPNIGHAAWTQALYTNCDLLDWLLERRRGESSWKCYLQFVDWQTMAARAGLPAAVIAVSLVWFWRRKVSAARQGHAVPTASDWEMELSNLAS